MEKQYYRHVAGVNPPDPALMGDPRPDVLKLMAWLGRMEGRTKKQKKFGYVTDMREMSRVKNVKRSWKNNG